MERFGSDEEGVISAINWTRKGGRKGGRELMEEVMG